MNAPNRTVQPKTLAPKLITPAVVQRSTNKPAPTSRSFPSAPVRPGRAVIQRVTYKGVLYDPVKDDEQQKFQAVAKADMEKAGTWGYGRSENIIKLIGVTAKTIESEVALAAEEETYWKEYDRELNENLKILVGIQAAIDHAHRQLETYLPRLKAEDLSVEVGLAVSMVQEAIKLIPEKWNLQSIGGEQVENEMTLLLKLKPWELEPAKKQKEEALQAATADRLQKIQLGQLPKGAKPTKTEKGFEKEIKRLTQEIKKAGERMVRVKSALDRLPLIKQRVETEIRQSAAGQYKRASDAHTSLKSAMKNKKLYLGEIATTEAIFKSKVKPHKARGVLWASPWAPGVNIAFLEGGVGSGAVYKLKTAVPDHLKQLLVEGKHVEFRAAVKDQGAKEYWPFWQGQHGRFTIYTDELTYLLQKGYRLHEFKRKDKSVQQIMIHPTQLDEVSAAYDGR